MRDRLIVRPHLREIMLLSLRVCETMVRLSHFEFRGQVGVRVTWEPYARVHCNRVRALSHGLSGDNRGRG